MKNLLVVFALLFATTVSADSRDCFDISVFMEANGDSDESMLKELERLQKEIRRFFAARKGVAEIPSEISLIEANRLITFLTEHEGFTIAIADEGWAMRFPARAGISLLTGATVFIVLGKIVTSSRGWFGVLNRYDSWKFSSALGAGGISAGTGYFTGHAVVDDECLLPEELRE